ncbi:UbiA family prenyltransferase [Cellulomonas sp. ATA003]|uniref:UbiA family prenyltransferase n=1 Tax=Cellulomonas sp. ATA003 TaxID=3073064 RepID=UPI002872DC0B|nr:UbiA family prenyltransferase [Cellulomonas sp. ATA003]WNB84399.1 UbiA family prenyltransferase [Cellulomonas sp. ATA003]
MTVLRTARALASSCHPAPAVAVTLFATALAAGVGAGPVRTVGVGAAVLAGQLSVGWSNDWIDAARDVAVGRTDKPVVAGAVSAAVVGHAAAVAAVLCVVLSFALGPRAGVTHVAAVAVAWAYNARLKSTVWSWLPYAVSFGLLACVVTLALPDPVVPPGWAIAAAALLGVGAHLANVLPDLEDDAATGVRGLPHRLGRTGTSLVAPVVLVAATVLVVTGPPGPPTPLAWAGGAAATGLALAAVTVAARRTSSRVPFTAAIGVAAVDVVLLVAAAGALV